MSNSQIWVHAVRCADIPLREGRSLCVAGREIAIFNLGDRFLAVANRCPHKGGPLAEGIVSGQNVICPLHAWKVDLETGEVARPLDARACAETFPVRVENGVLLVELSARWKAEKGEPSVCNLGVDLPPVSGETSAHTDNPAFGIGA